MNRIRPKRALIGITVLALSMVLPLAKARAIPSFARQTGMNCAACHTVFPQLTAFGRAFKVRGYTMTNVTREQSSTLQENYYPPLSAMMLVSMTDIGKKQPDTQNGNVVFPDQLGLFYAGRISDSAGAFAQITYNGVDDHFSMDNADIRFVGDTILRGSDLVYGLTVNNNPTVQDLWNSTPAWGFPFIASGVAPAPAAATLLDGTLAQQVAGLGVYGLWNNWLYAEVTLYRSSQVGGNQPPKSPNTGGTADENIIHGTAPYWRVAAEKTWGAHTLEVGTYGLYAEVFPGGGAPLNGPADTFTDYAFDAQYEFQSGNRSVTAHSTWIHEKRTWKAGLPLGAVSNASDSLKTFKVDATHFYKRMYGGSLGYFSTTGDADAVLFAPAPVTGSANGKPDSSGWIIELDYLPWLNMKFAVQYQLYDRFNGGRSNYDGSGRSASDNNTLYVYAWLMY